MSNYDSYRGVFGHECINELIVSRLMSVLGIPHLEYLICNRDRHGTIIEILMDEQGNARPSPLFDNGLSLLFSCYDDRKSIENFDVLKDRPVNNFIGSKSLEYNLHFIPKQPIFEGRLKENDRKKILTDFEEILPPWHTEKIWIMIWERWKRYVQICHQE